MWVAFLTHDNLLNKNNLPSELDSPILKKALNVLNVMNFDNNEREIYEGHLKWLSLEASALRKAAEKGRAEGIVEGRAEGIVEGRAEGRAEGEVEKAHAIACTMLEKGMAIQTISEITKLSFEAVQKLEKSAPKRRSRPVDEN